MSKKYDAATAVLNERWDSDEKIRVVKARIEVAIAKHKDAFTRRNRKAIDKLLGALATDWTTTLPKDLFEGYLDFKQLLDGFAPTLYSEIAGRQLFDLRGYNPDGGALRGVLCTGIDFSCLHAEQANALALSRLDGCLFDRTDLRDWMLGFWFSDCDFVNTDLSGLHVKFAYFENCRFKNCKLYKPKCFVAKLTDCRFENCDFRKAFIAFSVVENTVFNGCNFRQADLESSTYKNCRFSGCDFTNSIDGFIPPGVE